MHRLNVHLEPGVFAVWDLNIMNYCSSRSSEFSSIIDFTCAIRLECMNFYTFLPVHLHGLMLKGLKYVTECRMSWSQSQCIADEIYHVDLVRNIYFAAAVYCLGTQHVCCRISFGASLHSLKTVWAQHQCFYSSFNAGVRSVVVQAYSKTYLNSVSYFAICTYQEVVGRRRANIVSNFLCAFQFM
jgi:hypothetical protein